MGLRRSAEKKNVVPIRPKSQPPTDEVLKHRLMRAQSTFIKEQMLFFCSAPKADLIRYMRAQSDFIRAQDYILRQLGAS